MYRIYHGIISVSVLCVFLSACTPLVEFPPAPPAEETVAPMEYLIGPEDVIEVLVWKNDELSRVVVVRPDGKISLPLLGDMQAAGRTTEQLAAAITDNLKEYYNEPAQVTVIVQEINSYAVYLLGEVQKPGKYVVKSGTTFLQAIALGGGFTQFAATNKIVIVRKDKADGEKEIRIGLRYHDVINGVQENVLLHANDVIIVL